jgi:hypothetical protein
MQVSSTLIAAQQAAREAQARFQAQHAPKPAAFAAALDDAGFSALPLRQTAAAPVPAAPRPAPGRRMRPPARAAA